MRLLKHFFFAIAAVATAANAAAQFPGDVFFEDPNPVVFAGESVTLRVNTFTGTQFFGAALVDVAFPASEFVVDEVRAVETMQARTMAASAQVATGTGFAAYNASRLDGPFGTVSIVEIVGRPLVSAGMTTQVTLVPRQVVEPDGSPFATTNGFSATITVTAPNGPATEPPIQLVSPTPYSPDLDPLHAGVPLRRVGHEIVRFYPSGKGQLVARRERTVAPDPRDGL